jgi:hypothetical protein
MDARFVAPLTYTGLFNTFMFSAQLIRFSDLLISLFVYDDSLFVDGCSKCLLQLTILA